MRKLIFITAIFLFAGIYNAKAQSAFGVKIAPMTSWLKIKDLPTGIEAESDGAKMSIGFGPSFKKFFGDNFSADVSALFSWQNSAFKSGPTVTEVKLKYLQLPVIFEGGFEVVDGIKGLIDFGVSPAIKIGSVVSVEDKEIETDMSVFNMYLNAGAGVSYEVTSELMLTGSIMYNHGIFDVWYNKDSNKGKQVDAKMFNHFMSLNIGVYILF